MNPAQIETLRRKESLELSRKRVLHLIQNTQNPRYRTQLEKELAVLDARMAQLAGEAGGELPVFRALRKKPQISAKKRRSSALQIFV